MARSYIVFAACAVTGLVAVCTLLAAGAPVVPAKRPTSSAATTAAEPRAHRSRRLLGRQPVSSSSTHSGPPDRKHRSHMGASSSTAAATAAAAAAAAAASHGPPPAGIAVTYTEAEGYRSQDGQDKWVDRHIFHGRRGGVFVDLGCYDGVTYSNTWYFERQLGWSGVCVEPNPGVFPRIADQAGRTSGVQVAVSDHDGSAMFVAAYMRSSLNESAVDYDFLAQHGVATDKVPTKVVTPTWLLTEHLSKVSNIEYVNIDVESQELAILRVWPFDRWCVDVFNVENQPPHGEDSILPPLLELLSPHGYRHLVRIGVDEVFQRDPPCSAGHTRRGARRLLKKSERRRRSA